MNNNVKNTEIKEIFEKEFNLASDNFYQDTETGDWVLTQIGCRAIASKLGLEISQGELLSVPFINGKEGERVTTTIITFPFTAKREGKVYSNVGAASIMNTRPGIGQDNIVSMAYKRGYCKVVIMAAEDYICSQGYQLGGTMYSESEMALRKEFVKATTTEAEKPTRKRTSKKAPAKTVVPPTVEEAEMPLSLEETEATPMVNEETGEIIEETPVAEETLTEETVPVEETPTEEIPEEEEISVPEETNTEEAVETASETVSEEETVEEPTEEKTSFNGNDPYKKIVRQDLGGIEVPDTFEDFEMYVSPTIKSGHDLFGKTLFQILAEGNAMTDRYLNFLVNLEPDPNSDNFEVQKTLKTNTIKLLEKYNLIKDGKSLIA